MTLYHTRAAQLLDVCRDNASGERLETLISLFNASVDAPVMLTRQVQ